MWQDTEGGPWLTTTYAMENLFGTERKTEMNINGMSADELDALAAQATRLASDLRKTEPSYALALAAGVRDIGYRTVANGYISSYSGEAIVTMADGRQWKAIGHRPAGNAKSVSREGYIEFVPLGVDQMRPENG